MSAFYQQCEKTFIDVLRLVDHRRYHRPPEEVKVFICEKCGKGYASQNSLRKHKKWHDGYVYQCKECPGVFKHSSTYREHYNKIHLKVMRNQCKFCGRRFWQIGNMGKHIKIKHQDGIIHHELFAENDKKDWSNVTVAQRVPELMKQRRTREDGDDALSKHGASSSAVVVNAPKTKKSNSQGSKRKKVNDSQEATAIVEEAQVSHHSFSSSIYIPNNEANDFSQIQNPLSTTCTMISMTDPHETNSTQALQQSASQSHQYQPQHDHNTRYSAHQQQKAVCSVP